MTNDLAAASAVCKPRATRCTGRNDLSPLDNVTLIPISPQDLVASEHNARTRGQRQVEKLAASIQAFGFNDPILIDQENRIIGGHARVEAAKLLGTGCGVLEPR